jgi:putative transposase
VDLILQIKRDNPRFGSVKIEKTLAQMGIKVSRYTVCKVLKDNGLDPIDDNRPVWKKWVGAFADEVWAMDFCFTQLRSGAEAMIFVACDTFTKEIMEIRVFRGRDFISANDVAATLGRVFSRFKRRPLKIVHDRDPLFGGQVVRMLAVEEIKELKSPPRYPTMNCFAERSIQSIKHELLDHVRPESPEDLQQLLDEFATWFNQYRAHEGLGGMTPADYATGRRIEHVVPIRDLGGGTVERIAFANGLLTGYRWVDKPELAEAA